MESKDTVLITGATGLIGSNLVKDLLNRNYNIIAFVRDIDKARKLLGYNSALQIIKGDISEGISVSNSIDYIIHAASQTSSLAFVNEPVETMLTSIIGTKNILELAREKKVKSLVYLSTMEIYGCPSTDELIDENHANNIDTMNVRSSYSESKRACETMCKAYYSEYNVPTKVIRLSQTFGHVTNYNDSRVFAEFARCRIEGRNIILKTRGKTCRSYLSSSDAVEAIITVMLKGISGEAYNATNESTYCSIYDMAKLVAGNEIKVEFDIDDLNHGYAPELHMNLNSRKLRNLGWSPKMDLKDMFTQLINEMQTLR